MVVLHDRRTNGANAQLCGVAMLPNSRERERSEHLPAVSPQFQREERNEE